MRTLADNRYAIGIFLMGITVISAAQVIYCMAPSLNLDEQIHYFFAMQANWFNILKESRGDAHPPLYYFLLHLWTRLGTNPFFLRSLNLAIFLICVVFSYHVGRLWKLSVGRSLAIAATFGLSYGPSISAGELRAYSLASLFLWGNLWYAKQDNARWKFTLMGGLAILTAYASVFPVVVVGLLRFRKHIFLPFLFMFFIIGVFALWHSPPFQRYAILQIGAYQKSVFDLRELFLFLRQSLQFVNANIGPICFIAVIFLKKAKALRYLFMTVLIAALLGKFPFSPMARHYFYLYPLLFITIANATSDWNPVFSIALIASFIGVQTPLVLRPPTPNDSHAGPDLSDDIRSPHAIIFADPMSARYLSWHYYRGIRPKREILPPFTQYTFDKSVVVVSYQNLIPEGATLISKTTFFPVPEPIEQFFRRYGDQVFQSHGVQGAFFAAKVNRFNDTVSNGPTRN